MAKESTTPDLGALARGLLEATNARDLDAMMSFYASQAVFEAMPEGGLDSSRGARRYAGSPRTAQLPNGSLKSGARLCR
jgi:hypothetical protein